jgi:pimeloyl-ACP methyl ester carboxylesterase
MDLDYVVVPALILLIGILVIWLSIRRLLSLSAKVSGRCRRIAERIVLPVIVLVVGGIAASAIFNAIALHWFRAHNPPPGEIYIVDGHKMRMYCTGSGTPTIVLEAGLGDDAFVWRGVQPVLSKTTRVCAYDRAGLGWSDPLPPPRDADHIAADLHGLLREAKITGPVVLMGHSVGGIYLRDYASRYPENVAGIVFVDSSTPLQDKRIAAATKAEGGIQPPPQWVGMLLQRAVLDTGIPRLLGECSRTTPGFNAYAGRLAAEDGCSVRVSAIAAEDDSFDRSGEETVHTAPYGALSILIFSHDPAVALSRKFPPAWVASPALRVDVENIWSQEQEDLKKLSTHSRRIVAKGSNHYIQWRRPDLIEKEVPLFIGQIRGTAPQPATYGATTTE